MGGGAILLMTCGNGKKLHSQLLSADTILWKSIVHFEFNRSFISISEWNWFNKRWRLSRDRHAWQFIFSGSSQRSTSECVDTYGKESKCPHSLCLSSSSSQWEGMFQVYQPIWESMFQSYTLKFTYTTCMCFCLMIDPLLNTLKMLFVK